MKFYRVQLNDLFLTQDGTADGLAAKLQIAGADALLFPFTGSTIIAADGTPINQVFETGTKGKVLEIRIETYLYKAVWDEIVALINAALTDDETINIVATGDLGNINTAAAPLLPRPFEAEQFENGRILKPIFRFITS